MYKKSFSGAVLSENRSWAHIKFTKKYAAVAQVVEQRIRNSWVGCANHPSGSNKKYCI